MIAISIRKSLFSSSLSFSLLRLLTPSSVFAQILDWQDRDAGCVYEGVATIQGVTCLIANILASATTLIGLASFVMVVIGAFLYLTSGGNTKGTEAAKQSITYAIIGIVVALMAYFILNLISQFTGVTGILEFNLNIGN